jgi:hypothetical protein
MNSEKPERSEAQTDRRAFLASAGKLAVGVPPTLIVLLSTSMSSPAIAQSSGGSPCGGGGFYGDGCIYD